TFNQNDVNIDNINNKTTLTEWLKYNCEHTDARDILYNDFPKLYRWERKKWIRRKNNTHNIGRMYTVSISDEERFYLRLLLTCVPGATSFQHLRAVNNILYPTNKSAAQALGLLEDDVVWRNTLREAAENKMPKELRECFAFI